MIRQEIDHELILGTTTDDERMDDSRALNGYVAENVDQVYQSLIHYQSEQGEKHLQKYVSTCLICIESFADTQRIRLHRCGHGYCQACLDKYVQMALSNGRYRDRLVCPQIGCQNVLRHHEMKQITSEPAVIHSRLDDTSANERSERQRERDRRKLAKRQEKAQTESARINEHQRAAAERELARQTYREITIDLVEEDTVLEAILNAERLEVMNTQLCPNCRVRIEKDGGCLAMQCARCLHGFTWSKEQGANEPKMTSFLYHFPTDQSIASIREELNNKLDTGLKSLCLQHESQDRSHSSKSI